MAIIASDYRATSSVVSSSTDTKAVIYGDVNLDGSITQEDATVIQEYIGKVIPSLTDEQQIAGDVNGDGEITIADSALIVKYVNNIITSFPIES